mmetsp:Transcript_3978/g.11930  ORF Transcript_3978/g.11930 Transcript_3978/m.11930 type:complete len:182 (+) Transcript_3978:113-658(+)|eukprot:CAMPEP_0198733606 /NCGR_PEP_ID=MMETSP1475-20131203/46953_1 /TAXON_ID= ORGANISM="Unidentified sp., Strain CCMP1999" /NCGR_SAMPLE_ID=MMETSP1475 /ASSEMBLY_ACC=CAM_ASM_001111 /LENGTH=181 /DNA_ID=CAMNT_0044496933 /DNA_START=76 /DNA_END=621 /DNA_ORIENTATION=+
MFCRGVGSLLRWTQAASLQGGARYVQASSSTLCGGAAVAPRRALHLGTRMEALEMRFRRGPMLGACSGGLTSGLWSRRGGVDTIVRTRYDLRRKKPRQRNKPLNRGHVPESVLMRFKVTGNGEIFRLKAGRHKRMHKKSGDKKNLMKKWTLVESPNLKRVRKMLGLSGLGPWKRIKYKTAF